MLELSSVFPHYQPYALAVLRIITALLFIEHGTHEAFQLSAVAVWRDR